MKTVTVKRADLLDQLATNRAHHVDTFNDVLEAYRKKAVELLHEHIDRIKTGAVEKVNVNLPAPKNYEAEYDRAIKMVEWHTEDTIELDDIDFQRYVLDEWDWKQTFAATAMMYSE